MGKIENTKISVLIRSRNEERWIGHCIQSVLDNLPKPEIIVVDNNSNDSTREIVRYFNQDPVLKSDNKNYTKIQLHQIDNYTPGKSLNFGFKKARNNIVMVISAHCILKKINLEKILNEFSKFECIFGNQDPIYLGKKLQKDISGVTLEIKDL